MKFSKILILFLVVFLQLSKLSAQRPTLVAINEESELKPFKIALVVPFCTKYDKQEIAKKKLLPLQEAAIQYYYGLKLALDSLKRYGMQIQLNVYDTNRDSLSTLRILQKEEMKDMDLIIGPFFKEGIDMATEICKVNKVFHIAPTINVSINKKSPYIIYPNTELSLFSDKLFSYIQKADSGSQVYVLTDGKPSTQLFAKKINRLADSLHISVISVDATKALDWKKIAVADKKSSIIFTSNNDALVHKLFKSIIDTGAGIRIYGVESWLSFK
ncbi:MAG: hypothetical protein HYZ42_17095, partial [Bacteroidetes bacterium]|nr:hypothetical protein [Bacteroidota bacterium]